jgi:competence protein ComEA
MVLALLLGAGFGANARRGQGPVLPDAPGKAETQRLCSQCHEIDKSLSPRQDRAAWAGTVEKMVSFGMRASDDETRVVIDYLARHFPADDVPPIHVNTATAIQFESGLSLRRSQALTIIRYREANGPFHSLEDLLKVPGIDLARIEAKRDRLVFD